MWSARTRARAIAECTHERRRRRRGVVSINRKSVTNLAAITVNLNTTGAQRRGGVHSLSCSWEASRCRLVAWRRCGAGAGWDALAGQLNALGCTRVEFIGADMGEHVDRAPNGYYVIAPTMRGSARESARKYARRRGTTVRWRTPSTTGLVWFSVCGHNSSSRRMWPPGCRNAHTRRRFRDREHDDTSAPKNTMRASARAYTVTIGVAASRTRDHRIFIFKSTRQRRATSVASVGSPVFCVTDDDDDVCRSERRKHEHKLQLYAFDLCMFVCLRNSRSRLKRWVELEASKGLLRSLVCVRSRRPVRCDCQLLGDTLDHRLLMRQLVTMHAASRRHSDTQNSNSDRTTSWRALSETRSICVARRVRTLASHWTCVSDGIVCLYSDTC